MKGKRVILPVVMALFLSGTTIAAAASYLSAQNPQPLSGPHIVRATPMGAGFDIGWYNPIGGMGEMSSTSFRLNSTAGQPVIGDFSSTTYNLHMGFWQKFLRGIYELFLPFVRK